MFFLSNSSGRTRDQMVEKFSKLGVLDVRKEQMYGSAYISAHYLNSYHPQIRKVRVVGMNSICIELAKVGIECVGGENEKIECENIDDFFATELDCSIGAVVVGLDTKFTYKKLAMATLQIQSGKAKFFATNDDAYDMVAGRRSPGAGAMVTAI